MRELKVTDREEGLRLDKLLLRFMDGASTGFIYKMLRKKNIVLNGAKAKGDERVKSGDVIKLFLSEDTICGFQKVRNAPIVIHPDFHPDIIYEDDNIIIANKPAGLLSQKAKEDDISINEYLKEYCLEEDGAEKDLFTPSVCNRLDRNTSGIITFGKTLEGSRFLSELFRNKSLGKYYLAICQGEAEESRLIEGYLLKDNEENRVRITKEKVPGATPIKTEYKPLVTGKGATLMEIRLYTGKSHQIRAHLSSVGFPIIGDRKYGIMKYSAKRQMLHAGKLVFPEIKEGAFYGLSEKEFKAEWPEDFARLSNKLFQDFIF